jgi:hypothetical protein
VVTRAKPRRTAWMRALNLLARISPICSPEL